MMLVPFQIDVPQLLRLHQPTNRRIVQSKGFCNVFEAVAASGVGLADGGVAIEEMNQYKTCPSSC